MQNNINGNFVQVDIENNVKRALELSDFLTEAQKDLFQYSEEFKNHIPDYKFYVYREARKAYNLEMKIIKDFNDMTKDLSQQAIIIISLIRQMDGDLSKLTSIKNFIRELYLEEDKKRIIRDVSEHQD
jgi:hypothetical protein